MSLPSKMSNVMTSTMVVGSKEKRQQMDLDDPLREEGGA